MQKPKQILITLAVSVLVLGFMYLLFGTWFDYYEDIIAAIVYADLGTTPYDFVTHDIHFLIFPLLANFSAWLPGVPVYGVWIGLLTFIWLAGLVWLWFIVFGNHLRSANWFLVFSFALLFLLAVDSVQLLHSNRLSILLSGVSVLLLQFDTAAGRKRKLIYFLIFVLGLLTRLQTAFIVLGMLMIFFLIQGKSFKNLARKFYPHLILSVALLTAYQYYGANSNAGKLIETQYEFAIVDKQSFHPIGNMKTAADSARYIGITQYLVTDSASLTKEFIRQVVNIDIHFTDWASMSELKKQIPDFIYFLKNYWHSLVLLLLLVVLAAALNLKKEFWLRTALLLLAFILIIVFLALSFHMFDRVFSPLNALFIVSTLIFCLPAILNSVHASKFFLALSVCAFLVIYCKVPRLTVYKKEMVAHEKFYKTAIEKLGELTHRNIVVFLPADAPYTWSPFVRENHDIYDKLIFPDLAYYTYNRFAKERTLQRYGFSPVDYTGFYKFLVTHKDEVVVFSSESRIKLYENYFRVVYGYPLCFEEIPNGSFLPGNKLYRICR